MAQRWASRQLCGSHVQVQLKFVAPFVVNEYLLTFATLYITVMCLQAWRSFEATTTE